MIKQGLYSLLIQFCYTEKESYESTYKQNWVEYHVFYTNCTYISHR